MAVGQVQPGGNPSHRSTVQDFSTQWSGYTGAVDDDAPIYDAELIRMLETGPRMPKTELNGTEKKTVEFVRDYFNFIREAAIGGANLTMGSRKDGDLMDQFWSDVTVRHQQFQRDAVRLGIADADGNIVSDAIRNSPAVSGIRRGIYVPQKNDALNAKLPMFDKNGVGTRANLKNQLVWSQIILESLDPPPQMKDWSAR